MAGERRRYLRVLFEETIQVETEEWTDSMATGLDISLNGTRFHCEHSLSEGAKVQIMFRPDLKIEGEVRWCWPIEWYYQAAVEFLETSKEEQTQLREYISNTTGESYPEDSEIEEEETEILKDEIDLEEEADLFGNDEYVDSEDSTLFNGTLTPLTFIDKRVVIVDSDTQRIETINNYLTKRNQLTIEFTDKLSHLWPLLKAKPADLILLNWEIDNEDGIENLQSIQQRFPNLPIIFLSGSVSLEDRLEGLNEGAVDFISRPTPLSTIAQSILRVFASAPDSTEDKEEDDFSLAVEDEIDLSDDFLEDDELEL